MQCDVTKKVSHFQGGCCCCCKGGGGRNMTDDMYAHMHACVLGATYM
jgi:hypothetical protein